MPTLDELADSVFRDLGDAGQTVFSQLEIEDFIRGGVVEINRVTPQDTSVDIALVTDPDTGAVTQWSYDIGIELPYLVETIQLSNGYSWPMENADGDEGGPATGYIFKRTGTGGRITFPQWWLMNFDAVNFAIRVHGYAPRPLPYAATPSPVIAVSESEEYSVRAYAKSAGFDLLAHDRSLFAQWQSQPNNTDVSPTQMLQMAANSKQEWDRQRGLIRTVRRAG